MLQAECKTTTRRAILKSASTFIAAAALPVAAVAALVEVDDPIFALIENHRAAWDTHTKVVKTECMLEAELPWARKATAYCWNGEGWEITRDNPDDDPRWLQFWQDYIATHARLEAAAEALVGIQPTTMAGVTALASYAVEYVRAGETWPDGRWMFEDGGKDPCTITFETVLLGSIADSLMRVTGATP